MDPVIPASRQEKSWLQLHKRYVPIILTISIGSLILLEIARSIIGGRITFDYSLVKIVILTDMTIVPLAGMNAYFFLRKLLKKHVSSGWKAVVFGIIAPLVGVTIAGFTLEPIYEYVGFIDDDYLTIGGYTMSASMTNIVDHNLIALVICVPIAFWKLRLEELQFRLDEQELAHTKLAQLKTQAELHALEARINPHFLFNSFNSIAALIQSDPDKAENMVVKLSELFRYSLNTNGGSFVTVAEELKIIKIYLEIEKIRFGENFEYSIDASDTFNDLLIPRFLIQPLVENACKHSISKIKKGYLKIELTESDSMLQIRVIDNGPPFPEPLPMGFGLQSTLDKLNLLYPGIHSVSFENQPDKCVFITIPMPTNEQNL